MIFDLGSSGISAARACSVNIVCEDGERRPESIPGRLLEANVSQAFVLLSRGGKAVEDAIYILDMSRLAEISAGGLVQIVQVVPVASEYRIAERVSAPDSDAAPLSFSSALTLSRSLFRPSTLSDLDLGADE